MSKKEKSHFWASYADLMTSLFFLMVVLFIISIVELKQFDATPYEVKTLKTEVNKLLNELDSLKQFNSIITHQHKLYSEALDSMKFLTNATQAHIDKINEINNATKYLDQNYFVYDSIDKKHKLNFDVKFRRDDDNIYNVSSTDIKKLTSVGLELQNFIKKASINTPEIQYLLVIEGQASRNGVEVMDYNYDLSYRRARNLKKFWDNKNISFTYGNCEVLISGSGDGRLSGTGLMRETEESANQRFLIHILPKPGQIQ